jgi:F1F0 ATPase subunit 2
MNDFVSLVVVLFAGGVLGAFFYGGLWWTVRRGLASKRAAAWFFGSLLIRTGAVLLGFYVVLGDQWPRWVAGMLGFLLARLVVMRFTRTVDPLPAAASQGTSCI